MDNVELLYDYFSKSNISVIGYTTSTEKTKDKIISKISHVIINDIDPSICFKQFIRNKRIDSLLNNLDSNYSYIVIDLDEITWNSSRLSISELIHNFLIDVANSILNTNYKLIITSHLIRDIHSNTTTFRSYSVLLLSNFFCVIENDYIRVIKNGYSSEKIISLNGLEDYEYECNKKQESIL